MAEQTNVSRLHHESGEPKPKVYVPIGTFNQLLQKYASIAEELVLEENFTPLVESVGWIIEDLATSEETSKSFHSEMDSYITEQGEGLINFTLPNRSDHRHIRRGLYQICRQLDDWNNSHFQMRSTTSIFAKDCESENLTYVILALGPVNQNILSTLQYRELCTNANEDFNKAVV